MALKLWFPLTESLSQQGLTTPDTTYSNITITAGNANSASGVLGRYGSFNGSSSRIISSMAINSANLTVTCWVYSAGNCHLLDMRNSSGTGYQPMYFSLTSGIQMGGSGSGYAYVPYTFTANKWYHIAVVETATEGSLYVNGAYIGKTTTGKGYNYNTTLPVYIGSRYSGANWLNGRICDFRFYDEALSAKQIKEIYQSLTHHYRFNFVRPLDGITIPNDAGFGDNLHTVGTVTQTTDTPRNDKSSTFVSSSYAVSPYNASNGWLPQRALTVNIWAKWETWGWLIGCVDSSGNAGWEFASYLSDGISFLVNVYNSSYSQIGVAVIRSGVKTTTIANQWNMITGVFDGSNLSIYINGELKATDSIGQSNCLIKYSDTPLTIAARNPNEVSFVGSISDARIYATALTAEDIRKLYEVSASVDGEQVMRVYQATEDSSLTDRSKITKTGKLVASLIDDLSKSKVQLCDDGTVYVKDIKEI